MRRGDAGRPAGSRRGLTRDEAARLLWNEHYAPLAGWCAALVGDRDAAHDIASEAFTRLLSRWLTVHDPKGYLYVTATNLVRDRWRREQRDRRLCRLGIEETHAETSTPACDPWLRDLVERLPERLRMPVLLHYYADLSVAEIAATLHQPEGTIKRMLHDARAPPARHGWQSRPMTTPRLPARRIEPLPPPPGQFDAVLNRARAPAPPPSCRAVAGVATVFVAGIARRPGDGRQVTRRAEQPRSSLADRR